VESKEVFLLEVGSRIVVTRGWRGKGRKRKNGGKLVNGYFVTDRRKKFWCSIAQ
jgi:hypothetical protein